MERKVPHAGWKLLWLWGRVGMGDLEVRAWGRGRARCGSERKRGNGEGVKVSC